MLSGFKLFGLQTTAGFDAELLGFGSLTCGYDTGFIDCAAVIPAREVQMYRSSGQRYSSLALFFRGWRSLLQRK